MPSRLFAAVAAHRRSLLALPRWTSSRTSRRIDLRGLARRLAYFWFVWSLLLLVHEAGHAIGARRQGLTVRRLTAGVGPVLWSGRYGDTDVVLRVLPVVGVTTFGSPSSQAGANAAHAVADWQAWARELATIAGGVLATLALAVAMTVGVVVRERITATTWRWGRYVVADAVVLTALNFLPVPPLDGGRAVIGAVAAWRGVHLTGDALFWVQMGGLALAVIPMTLWTRWTARIDRLASRLGAPAAVTMKPPARAAPGASDGSA